MNQKEMEDLINDEQVCSQFGKLFLKNFIDYGFTTLSKNDLQDLILGALSASKKNLLLDDSSDYELANFFKTTDKKIAASRINLLQKQFFPIDRESQIKALLLKVKEKNCDYDRENNCFKFQINNSVQRREFESFVREQSYQVDYKNNRQILIISTEAFFTVLNQLSKNNNMAELLSKKFKTNISKENLKELIKKIGTAAYEITKDFAIDLIKSSIK